LWVLPNVLFQIILPLQNLLLWHHIPNDRHTPLPELGAEALGRMIEVFKVDIWNDLGAAFGNEWNLFSYAFQQSVPRLSHLALVAFNKATLQVSILRRERLKLLSRKGYKRIRDVACALLCVCRRHTKLCDGASRRSSDGSKRSKRKHRE
jgi:hypothetical protein